MGNTPTIVGDKSSNSFIIPPGGKITIPIARAYEYWTTQSVNISTNQNDITIELLWQDTKGLFFSPELRWDASNAEESVIYMETVCTPKKGNAVVAVKENGVIRWSWHVWVTDYDPDKSNFRFNRDRWMTQNLGALSTSPEDASTSGLYYQWGRKDPFPGAKDLNTSKIEQTNVSPGAGILDAIKPLYDGDSNPVFLTTQIPDLPNMLSKAVTTPTMFYYKTNPPQNPSSKWYASDDIFDDKTLWGGDADGDIQTSGSKSIYDPCPNGWQLPRLWVWNDLWRDVLNTGNIDANISSWEDPDGNGAVGFILKDFGFLQFGGSYYPTGNMEDIKSSMTLWSGTANAAGYAITMALSRTSSNTVNKFSPGTTGEHPAHGFNVRCIYIDTAPTPEG